MKVILHSIIVYNDTVSFMHFSHDAAIDYIDTCRFVRYKMDNVLLHNLTPQNATFLSNKTSKYFVCAPVMSN